MTLAISTITSSGIVLTADSRQTYKNQAGAIRIGSDSATKLFKLNDKCGVAISGRAFLKDGSSTKDAGFFVKEFADTGNIDGKNIKEVAQSLSEYLGSIFVATELGALKSQIEERVEQIGGTQLTFLAPKGINLPYSYQDKDGKTVSDYGWIETINMIVAGIDDDKVGRAFTVCVPGGPINEKDTKQCGALWVGQTDVILRIIKGYAPEIENLDIVKEGLMRNQAVVKTQFERLEYIINWGTITLQDAVDFCILMTRTTESVQRFSDGTSLAPGGIPGVGGEIDIAVITAKDGFRWLKQKVVKTEGYEINLNQ